MSDRDLDGPIPEGEDPIAEDYWGFERNGERVVAKVSVWRPRPMSSSPDSDWVCPVSAREFTGRDVVDIAGAGPVDALVNAGVLLRGFADSYRVSPREDPGE